MAKIITDNQHYSDIAVAIRTKNETETLYKPSEMASAILDIQGGVELNFEIVGGKVQPENPKENTIWVNTSTEITGWSFCFTEPAAPVPGAVWIKTDSDSYLFFNALAENMLNVYIRNVYQYANGNWEDAEAYLYKENAWVELVKQLILYDRGEQYTEITGGWYITGFANHASQLMTDHIKVGYSASSSIGSNIQPVNMLSFPQEGYSTLKILYDASEFFYREKLYPCMFGLSTYKDMVNEEQYFERHVKYSTVGTNLISSVDISTASGGYYVKLSNTSQGKVYKIWLE